MASRLPPLNAVQAFEAVARNMSFTRAAEELYVTHGAVSRQVKKLEEFLGLPLFHRLPRALVLTEAGTFFFPVVQDALHRIADGTRYLVRESKRQVLTVSVVPSFAARWLVQRLERFNTKHPEIEVLVNASFDLVDFSTGDIDMAIRLGRGQWPGLRADLLLTVDFFPVCSPKFMAGPLALKQPGDLCNYTLLHTVNRDDWKSWLLLAGVSRLDAVKEQVFNDYNVTLQAAMDGFGVALARSKLVDSDLKAGRLVKPFNISLPGEVAYYAVSPWSTAELPKIKAFRDWLTEEAQTDV